MTVISAIFSKYGISVATDSLLAAVGPNNDFIPLEWQQPKIICVPKLRACISYWGFAGSLKVIPKVGQRKNWNWKIYDWLKEQSQNPQESNLSEFAKNLKTKLQVKLNQDTSKKSLKGIGLHITGFENINGYWIPELFLICNFTDTTYKNVGDLNVSRHTYHTIANVDPSDTHAEDCYRMKVKEHLSSGNLIIYNNGNPTLFNPVFHSVSQVLFNANNQGVLRQFSTIQDMVPLVKRPIEVISKLQKDLFKENKRVVGGRTHDVSIDNSGLFYSTSGDK